MNADSLLLGGDPPDVRVPAAQAPWIAAALREAGIPWLRANGVPLGVEALAVVGALETASRRYRRLVTASQPPVEKPVFAVDTIAAMTVTAAAEALGCSRQNVRKLAQRGTLAAQRSGGLWLLDPAAVEARVARRAAGG